MNIIFLENVLVYPFIPLKGQLLQPALRNEIQEWIYSKLPVY